MNKRVCIFCGANAGNSQKITNHAKLLSDLLARAGYDLVYGGGGQGLMGLIADRFIENKAEVIGVRPKMLIENESTHTKITQMIVVESMQERKQKMIELSDLFIALPGGIGTLDEIIETFTLYKIGFTKKQSGILNTDGFYDHLMTQLEVMTNFGFLKKEELYGLIMGSHPMELLDQLGVNL